MAKVDGTVTLVKLNGSPIAHQQDATMNLNMDLPDATDKDDAGWTDHIAGLRDWSVDVNGLIDFTSSFGNDELRSMIINKETAALEFGSGVTGTAKMTGTVSLTSLTEGHPQYAPGVYTGSLIGKGALAVSVY